METALARRRITGPVDLVVLDPPRTGAGATVVRDDDRRRAPGDRLRGLRPGRVRPGRAHLHRAGWRLAALRAFDLFPMTQHVELIGLFLPPSR